MNLTKLLLVFTIVHSSSNVGGEVVVNLLYIYGYFAYMFVCRHGAQRSQKKTFTQM